MRLIWTAEGLPGFFKGLEAQLLKTVLAAALMLMIKEKVTAGTAASLTTLREAMGRGSRRAQTGKAAASSAGRQTARLTRPEAAGSPSTGTSRISEISSTALPAAIERALTGAQPILASIRPLEVKQGLRLVGSSPPVLMTSRDAM